MMLKSEENQLFILRINEEMAAFYYGTSDNNGCLHFVRVAVNDNFARYSPGIILGNEIIKMFNGECKIFDFTRGREEYKSKLGCVEVPCKNINIII